MRLPVTVLCLTLAAGGVYAAAHGANPAVQARNAHMAMYSFNLGQMGAMAKGEMPYDAAAATAAAERLLALASMDETGYWPDGTAQGEVEGSRALPAVFTEADKFKELRLGLVSAAEQTVAVAGDGAAALGPQMAAIGQACGACHKVYRGPDS